MDDKCMDFGNRLIKSIHDAQRLMDIVVAPAPRLRKKELEANLTGVNILRLKFSTEFSETTQKLLEEKIPAISKAIDRNDFDRVSHFTEQILDGIINDGLPILAKCICSFSPKEK